MRPAKQRALAAAVGARVFELAGDHFCFWANAKEFADVTRQAVDDVVSRLAGGRRPERLDRLRHLLQAVVEVRRRDHVGQRQADAGDLAGQELGVGLHPGAAVPVALALGPVPVLLAVLGQQDERRGVGGLEREDQGEEDEASVVGVELERPTGAKRVPDDPQDDGHRLEHEEAGGAEEAGDPLGELAEGIGVVVEAELEASPPRGVDRSSRRLTTSAPPVGGAAASRPAASGRARRRR